jgi:integrase
MKVQSLCKEIDDDMRWLIALISDTGMRLGEAAGLLKEDIKLHERIPLMPCSRMVRLIIDLTAVKTRLTVLRLMPCSKHQSRNFAASEVAYEGSRPPNHLLSRDE